MNGNPFEDAVIVSRYTDREAVEDGLLVPVSTKDRVSRAAWEYLAENAPAGAKPPDGWPVDMMGWFTAEKVSKTDAQKLLAEHGAEEGQKKLNQMIADSKALALAKGVIRVNSQTACRVYEENIDGGIWKLFSIQDPAGKIARLQPEDPGKISGKKVLWFLSNENGGITLMFPEDY